MFVVQAQDGSVLLQQQQQPVTFRGQQLQAQQVAVYPQQRMAQVSVNTAQLAQQKTMFAGAQANMATPGPAAVDSKQVVYVNVNGTLQRGIVQNGAVYLLPNDSNGLQAASSMPQAAVQQNNGGQVIAGQQFQQQQMMVQQVLPNGQLVRVSAGPLVASRAGVQLPAAQQPHAHIQPQMQARIMPAVSMGIAPQRQQQPMMLVPTGGANMASARMMPANSTPPAAGAVGLMQAHPQQVMLQVPQAATRGPAMHAAPAAAATMFRPAMVPAAQTQAFGNSVSASTASMMPRLAAPSTGAAGQAARPNPVGSQPMTIAAALAALPSNPATGATVMAPATSSELSSPVAPPGTPGMNTVVGAGQASGTFGAAISKLAASQEVPVATTIISGPPSVAQGASPVTSQPGTPSRSNSVGAHSSSSSSSGGSGATDADVEAKMSVMRMLACTFIETGIGLEQALSMIQASDKEMLATAFAAELAAAVSAAKPGGSAESGSAVTANATAQGLATLGGEQIVMAPAKGRTSEPNGLQKLSATSDISGAFDGALEAGTAQDNYSLGSWGFSLFSSVASDIGSNKGGSSFGGIGDKVNAACTAASATDEATASLFANLHV